MSEPSLETQLNAVCDEFEDRVRAGEQPDLADFLSGVPAEGRERLAALLAAIDAEVRTRGGQVVHARDYRRFGEAAERAVDEHLRNLTRGVVQPGGGVLGGTRSIPPDRPAASEMIGPYKLLQEIGQGGMGVVWMAEQEHPVRRRVALKVIKAGMDTREVISRFEAERQALALMDHQNIAKVLDAGTTLDGRPFFVMELVPGIALHEYCDKNRLTLRKRLELFIPVCHAIQHAHQKGIIHRDIKPSNVLVTMYDGVPVPKVIDFGLAKALQAKLSDHTLFTHFGQVLGTLQYMSPEQTEMNALDVDTRSDVYSLGVMLYELLTGSTPLDRSTLKHEAMDRVLHMIREAEPPRPSRRLSDSGDAMAAICKRRHIEPRRLGQLLRGDLDWIVMKALEKDRTRRYESAGGFAADVRRYLSDEPIEARPPSTRYRFVKYFRRHRVIVSASAVILVLLVVGIAGTGWQAIRASRAQRIADRALTQALASEKQASQLRAAEAVARAKAERLATSEESARKSAEENYRLAREAVDAYFTRVANDQRLARHSVLRKQLLEDARQFYEHFIAEHGDEELTRDVIQATFQIAELASLTGSKKEAIAAYERAIQWMKEQRDSRDYRGDLATACHNVGLVHLNLDDYQAAQSRFEEALALRSDILSDDPDDLRARVERAESLNALSMAYVDQYQAREAIPLLQEAVSISQQLVRDFPKNPKLQSDCGARLNSLATARVMLNQPEEAIRLLRQACSHQRLAIECDASNMTYVEYLANHQFNLARILQERSDDAAVEALNAARNEYERLVRSDPTVVHWQLNLAKCYTTLSQAIGDPSQRMRYLEQARTILDNQLAVNENWNNGMSLLAETHHRIANELLALNQRDQAATHWQLAMKQLRKLIEGDPVNRVSHRSNLARSLTSVAEIQADSDSGAVDSTLSECEEQLRILVDQNAGRSEFVARLAECLQRHGVWLCEARQWDRAREKLQQADAQLVRLSQTSAEGLWYATARGHVFRHLAETALGQDDVDAAIQYYDRAIELLGEILESSPGYSHAITSLFSTHRDRVQALMNAGRYDQAIHACQEAYDQTDPQYRAAFDLVRANCAAKKGDYELAVQTVEGLVGNVNFDAAAMYNVAAILTIAADGLKSQDAARSSQVAGRAIQWVERSLAAGIDAERFTDDPDFRSLSDHAEFQRLIDR